jgi:hypothetical protein
VVIYCILLALKPFYVHFLKNIDILIAIKGVFHLLLFIAVFNSIFKVCVQV